MRWVAGVFVILLAVSCGHVATKRDTNQENKGDRPSWIFNPMLGCNDQMEICVVGEGTSLTEAQAEARRAMALVFEAKIEGEKNYYKSYSEKSQGNEESRSQSDEMGSQQLREITDQILKGVVIKQSYKETSEEHFYAQASLDRFMSSQELQKKMRDLDSEMESMRNQKGRGSFRKMLDLYQLRESIGNRYQFLRGVSFPSSIDLDEIYAKKKESIGEEKVVVNLAPAENFGELAPFISQLLTDNGYKIVDYQTEGQWTLKGSLHQKEEYLSVQGFKRYSFILELVFYNKSGEKIKTTQKIVDETGRSFQQIWQKAITKFKDFLQDEWKYISIGNN